MSKRLREEENIESLKAILGDIPIETIEDLLNKANQNIETAVNLYFSDPPPPPPPPVQQINQTRLSRADIKFYLGDLVITGTSFYLYEF